MPHDVLKKGSTELIILALLDARPRHGYEIGKLIESRTNGRLTFRIGSLYPVLCRLEDRGLVSAVGSQNGGRGPNAALYSVVPSSAYVAALYVEHFDMAASTPQSTASW